MKIPTLLRKIKLAWGILQSEGLVQVLIVSLEKLQRQKQRKSTDNKNKVKFKFLAKTEDILKADWVGNPYISKKNRAEPPYTINWVMSPPDKGLGGGHQNIFRFIEYLESQGHTCRVYLYSNVFFQTAAEAEQVYRKAYPESRAKFEWLKGPMEDADAIFATGWETAYPVFNDPSKARRFYFIQDFEPYFYPIGSEYTLAENTYKMNFYGITAGGWLTKKLSTEYGMDCDYYDFGTDTNLYQFNNTGKRKEVFFYARPITERRAFELGIMALQIFHEKMPDYKINLAGWDVSEYDIPFPYNNLKSLSLNELSDVYNKCAVALVMSLTNMSLMPLELLAAGTIPVVNDGENNRLVSDNPYIKYVQPSPAALANAMVETVSKNDLPRYAEKASSSVKDASWERSGRKMEDILIGQLNG
jgi:O-antigen biosynthesis protein